MRKFRILSCDDSVQIKIDSGALGRVRALKQAQFKDLGRMVVEEGGLKAEYTYSPYVQKINLEIENVSNLVLNGGAISGNGHNTVDIKSCDIGKLPKDFLQSVNLARLKLSNNVVGEIETGAVGDRAVIADFTLANNTISVLSAKAFQSKVLTSCDISGNLIRKAESDAFRGIEAKGKEGGAAAVMTFRRNSLESWEEGCLAPSNTFTDKENSDRIGFEATFLGIACTCQDQKLDSILLGR